MRMLALGDSSKRVWATMTTYTWIGNNGSNDPNDVTQAVNWSPVGVPGTNDTAIIGTGATLDAAGPGSSTGLTLDAAGSDILNLTNQNFISASMTLGASTTLNLTGTIPGAAGFDITNTNVSPTQIHQSGSASALSINAYGSIDSNGFIWLNSANGSLAINISSSAPVSGDFYNDGAIFDVGGALTITDNPANQSNRFSNASYMLVASVNGVATATISARMDATSGEIEVMGNGQGATLDIATNMPGGQFVVFGDNDATVKIEATTTLGSYANVNGTPTTVLQNSFERFAQFGAGDTIDLVGIAVGSLTYSFGDNTTYGDNSAFGNNVLTIYNSGTVIARLRMSGSSSFADGSGSFATGIYSSNFILSSDGSGGTDITVAAAPVTVPGGAQVGGASAALIGSTTGGTLDWAVAANWTGGTGSGGVPGQYQSVQIVNSLAELTAFNDYTLNVSTTVASGGLSMDDHFLTLNISGALTLAATPGQSTGGTLNELSGTLDIAAGGHLTATNLYSSGGTLVISAGAVVALAGNAPFSLGTGLASLTLENSAEIDGGTLNAGGAIIMGENASSSLLVQTASGDGASVTASYTVVGANSENDPNQSNGLTQSYLSITGAGTVYRDVGGDSTTPLAGALLVGGGGVSVNAFGTSYVTGAGSGSVNIDNGATLLDSGYAILGMYGGGSGTVDVQNSAQWTIGGTGAITLPTSVIIGSSTIYSATPALLTVGLVGSGTLNIDGGGTVTLGSELSSAGEFNLAIGQGGPTVTATGNGSVSVNGGLLDSHLGAIAVGNRGVGSLSISNGGTVLAGSGGGENFGVTVGNQNYVLNGVTTASIGTVTVGGSGTNSLLNDTSFFIDGRNGIGHVSLELGGTLDVGAVLFIGGNSSGAGASTDTGSNFVLQGGTADISVATTLFTGSTLELDSGAMVVGGGIGAAVNGNIVVGSGANLSVFSGGDSNTAVLIDNGGSIALAGTIGLASNVTLMVGGAVGGPGTLTIGANSEVKLENTVYSGTTVSMGGTSSVGTVEIKSPSSFGGDITNFWGHAGGSNNTLLLDSIGTSLVSQTWVPDPGSLSGTLDVVTSTGSANIAIAGYHPGGFSVVSDSAIGGLMITAVDTAPCFASGTRISTRDGAVAVEALEVGCEVLLADGGMAPIVWIGQRTLDCSRHPRPQDVMPVRVCAHAFGPGQPHTDLVLSPDHAVFADGVLIPVRYLLNGVTIVQEAAGRITYWHVELARHAVLLAEGLPCESYLDTGNRDAFAGGSSTMQLHPDFARAVWDEKSCARLVVDGCEREAVRSRLLEQASLLGHCLVADPGLVVFVGNQMIAGDVTDGRWRFVLPANESVRLVSRRGIPAFSDPASDDTRAIGVAIAGLWLDGARVALDGTALCAGWHPVEAGWRWTDGDAVLATDGAVVLEVSVAMTGRYWLQSCLPPERRAIA